MKARMLLGAVALTLGLVVAPASAADAHTVTGKTEVKKPQKLTGTVVRGWAKTEITKSGIRGIGNEPYEFDKEHIQSRRLVSYIEVKSPKPKSEWRIDSRSLVHEGWNRRYSSGPQRPNTKCRKGDKVRTVAVHTVFAPDVWKVGQFTFHGAVKRNDITRKSRAITC